MSEDEIPGKITALEGDDSAGEGSEDEGMSEVALAGRLISEDLDLQNFWRAS